MPWNALNTIKNKKPAGGGVNWVTVGTGSPIITSSDGLIWNAASSFGGLTTGYGVAYGKDGTGAELWVAVGAGSAIAKSSDGSSWKSADSSGGLIIGYGVAYGKDNTGAGLWVAVGTGSKIVKSTDGTNWSAAQSPYGNIGTKGWCVSYGNGIWIAGGDNTRIVRSINGTDWSAVTTIGNLGSNVYGVVYDNAKWLALGTSYGSSVVRSTDNGINWSSSAMNNNITENARAAAYGLIAGGSGSSRWVALGAGNGGNNVAISADGSDWSSASNFLGFGSGRGIAYGNGKWIAVGESSQKMIWSTTGGGWVAISSLDGLTAGYCIAFKK